MTKLPLFLILIASLFFVGIVSAEDNTGFVNATIAESMTIQVSTSPVLENWELTRTGVNTISDGLVVTVTADHRADVYCSMPRDGVLYSQQWGNLFNRLQIGGHDLRDVPGYEPIILTTTAAVDHEVHKFDLTQVTTGENYGNYQGTITCAIRSAI